MKTKTIAHKLATITIEYGYNNNPWTDEDEALVKALEMMYDEELRLNKEAGDLMTDYFAAERATDTQPNELEKVTATLKSLSDDAEGFREFFGLSVPQSFIEFAFRVDAAAKQIAGFRAAYMEHSNHEETLRLRLDQANPNLDDITLWDEYDSIQTRHFDNCEANSMDFVKYNGCGRSNAKHSCPLPRAPERRSVALRPDTQRKPLPCPGSVHAGCSVKRVSETLSAAGLYFRKKRYAAGCVGKLRRFILTRQWFGSNKKADQFFLLLSRNNHLTQDPILLLRHHNTYLLLAHLSVLFQIF